MKITLSLTLSPCSFLPSNITSSLAGGVPKKWSTMVAILATCFIYGSSPQTSFAQTTLTTTTASADGGFDGTANCGGFQDSTGTQLATGNVQGPWMRAGSLLMFDLSAFGAVPSTDIISATISFNIEAAYNTPQVTVEHGTLTSESLSQIATQGVSDTPWTDVITTTSLPSTIGVLTIDVTSRLLADLAAGNAYSSYRLVTPDTYADAIGLNGWGQVISSSENTSGYLVPTLTLTVVPEPSTFSLIACAGAIGLLVHRRITASRLTSAR